jgi:hypothetical protein
MCIKVSTTGREFYVRYWTSAAKYAIIKSMLKVKERVWYGKEAKYKLEAG